MEILLNKVCVNFFFFFFLLKYDPSLLFLVLNAGCSFGPCGDTDNYVCTDLNCKGKHIMSAKSKSCITSEYVFNEDTDQQENQYNRISLQCTLSRYNV